jgi:hypothetical protein
MLFRSQRLELNSGIDSFRGLRADGARFWARCNLLGLRGIVRRKVLARRLNRLRHALHLQRKSAAVSVMRRDETAACDDSVAAGIVCSVARSRDRKNAARRGKRTLAINRRIFYAW